MGLALATAASQAMLLGTEVGQTALVDQWERTALAFGQDVDDARYAQFQALSRNGPVYGVATALIDGPVLTVAVATLIFMVFRGKANRAVSYSQVLSVLAHASVILAIRQRSTSSSSGGWFWWRSVSRYCTRDRHGRWQPRSWGSTPASRCYLQ